MTNNKSKDFRYLQVRLSKDDALKFKHRAEFEGLNVQQAMVEAISKQLESWGELPCFNPGTTRTKTK